MKRGWHKPRRKINRQFEEDKFLFIGTCQSCGLVCDDIAITHHINGVGGGGSSDYNNLIVLCPNCHALVHKKHITIKSPTEVTWHIEPLKYGFRRRLDPTDKDYME